MNLKEKQAFRQISDDVFFAVRQQTQRFKWRRFWNFFVESMQSNQVSITYSQVCECAKKGTLA